ncbi:MAG TPA: hypothetical protein V6C81_03535 [Planktothrix sp.]
MPGAELASIDGLSLRGLSDDGIEALMREPMGSTATVKLLDLGGSVREVKLTRGPLVVKDRPAPTDLTEALDEVDYGLHDVDDRGNRWEEQDLDLIARADCSSGLYASKALPGDNSSIIGQKAAEGFVLSTTLGDLPICKTYELSLLEHPDIQISFGSYADTARKVISNLIALGRLEDAEKLCKTWIEMLRTGTRRSSTAGSDADQLNLLLAEVLYKEQKQSESLKVLEQVCDPKSGEVSTQTYAGDDIKIGRLLERLGAPERAELCYEHSLQQFESRHQKSDVLSLERARTYGYTAYQLAMIQDHRNETAKAIAVLRRAIEIYSTQTRPDERALSEKLPVFFPRETDLDVLLARLYLKAKDYPAAKVSAESSVELISQAVGKKHSDLREPFDVLAQTAWCQNRRDEAKRLRRSIDELPRAITRSDKSEVDNLSQRFAPLVQMYGNSDTTLASSASNELARSYAADSADFDYREPPINEFCALIQFARYLSDLRLFEESNKILACLDKYSPAREANPVASALVKVEMAINAERQKSSNVLPSSDNLWNQIISDSALATHSELQPTADTISPSRLQVEAEKTAAFRALAVIYEAAGEHSRADLLMNHAIKQESIVNGLAGTASNGSKSSIAHEKIILLLDQARLCANRGRIEDAQMYGKNALALCATSPSDNGDEGLHFSQLYRSKVVDLANALKTREVKNKAIEDFLVLVNSKLATGATKGVKQSNSSYVSTSFSGFDSLIDTKLAELTFEDNNYEQAEKYVSKALSESGQSTSYTLWMLGAQIAEKSKDYESAAHRYSQAMERLDAMVNLDGWYKLRSQKLYLGKAWAFISHDAAFDKVEAANIGLRYGQTLQRGDWRKGDWQHAVSVFEQVEQLTPDSDPGKTRLLQEISGLKSSIAVEQSRSAKSSQQATPERPPSDDEKRAQKLSEAHARIDQIKLKMANDARNSKVTNWDTWLTLAYAEADAQMLTTAENHVVHAIQEYRRPRYASEFPQVFITGSGAEFFAKQEHQKEGEQLLTDALKKMQDCFGTQSPAAANQLVQIADYQFKRGRNEDGFKTLSQVLRFNQRTLDVAASSFPRVPQIGGPTGNSAIQSLYQSAEELSKRGDGETALKILTTVLGAERNEFPADDSRIALTLSKIALVELKLQKKDSAKAHIIELAKIYKLYYGYLSLGVENEQLVNNLWKNIADGETPINTRDVGRIYPSLLRALGQTSLAETIEREKAMPSDYIDPLRSHELVNNRDHLSTAQRIENNQKEYSKISVETPYGARAASVLDNLMREAIVEQQWKTLAFAAEARCGIYERFPDISAGHFSGCVIPENDRIDYYSRAARAYIHLNEPDKAKEWLLRAAKVLPEPGCAEYVTIATWLMRSNNKDLAIHYADLADQQFDGYYAAELCYLWKQLGRPENAQTIEAKAKEFANEDKQRQNRKPSAFDRTGI